MSDTDWINDLVDKYNDYVYCDEYHIHSDEEDTDHQGSTPLPHDFDEDKLKAAIEQKLTDARIETFKAMFRGEDITGPTYANARVFTIDGPKAIKFLKALQASKEGK